MPQPHGRDAHLIRSPKIRAPMEETQKAPPQWWGLSTADGAQIGLNAALTGRIAPYLD